MSAIDISGQRFGRLTVVARDGSTAQGIAKWLCRCDCGETCSFMGSRLRNGTTRSCGCFQRQRAGEANTTHGLTSHPLYRVLRGMVSRCYNSKSQAFHRYGGRGISVCGEWRRDSSAFVNWGLANGWILGLTIDRIDNDGNYEPSNCRFVTNAENNENKSARSTWRRLKKPGAFQRALTTCANGHPLDGVRAKKDRSYRFCTICVREQGKRAYARRLLKLGKAIGK